MESNLARQLRSISERSSNSGLWASLNYSLTFLGTTYMTCSAAAMYASLATSLVISTVDLQAGSLLSSKFNSGTMAFKAAMVYSSDMLLVLITTSTLFARSHYMSCMAGKFGLIEASKLWYSPMMAWREPLSRPNVVQMASID